MKKLSHNHKIRLQELAGIPKNPIVIFLIGLPGSGKSTYIKNLLSKYPEKNFKVISTDDIFEKLGKEKGLDYTTAFKTFKFNDIEMSYYKDLENAVKEKRNIIIDRTNVLKKDRDGVFSKLTGDYKSIAIIFDINPEELKQRLKKRELETGKHIPDEVVDNMRNSYVEPSLSEFDKIIKA